MTAQHLSDELRIALTFPSHRQPDKLGFVKYCRKNNTSLTRGYIENERNLPDREAMDKGLREMQRVGFSLASRGRLTVSVRGKRRQFEQLFGTKLGMKKIDSKLYGMQPIEQNIQTSVQQNIQMNVQRLVSPPEQYLWYPAKGVSWNPTKELTATTDDCYIQYPQSLV